MQTLTDILWKRLVIGLALALGGLAGYAALRLSTSQGATAWIVVELVGLMVLVAVGGAWYVAKGLLRPLLEPIERAAGQLQALAANPSARLPDAEVAELQPLHEAAESIRGLYVRAIDDFVKQAEERARLVRELRQSDLGRADAEKGQSHSAIQRGAGAAHDMVARLAPNLQWMAATPTLQQFLGWPIVELTGRLFTELVHTEDVEALSQQFQGIRDKGEGHNVTFRLLDREGGEHHVQMDVLVRYTPENTPLHFRCHFLDITARVLTERELRRRTEELSQANERLRRINLDLERLKEGYRDLYHFSPVMYFSLDAQARFATCNQTMLRKLGYERDELVGQTYASLLTAESQKRFQAEPDWYQSPGETQMEVQWLKKDGTVIDVWVRSLPLQDARGRFLRTRSVAQDVTERKRLADELHSQAARLRKANEDLLRINRELDDFTYVVSHDLKEPLRTIDAFSNMLSQDYGKRLGPEATEYLSYLIQASSRMSALIEDLLVLSRAGRITNVLQLCHLDRLVDTVQHDLAVLIQRKRGSIRMDGTPEPVMADPQRLAQLFVNLLSNGLKYNQSERPEVVVGQIAADGNGQSDGMVTLYVRDNGIGIDPRYHEQIFKIFRRLHARDAYEGTGAGLAICQKIIESHGGRIWLESAPGRGTTFYFTLPRAAAEAAAPPVADQAATEPAADVAEEEPATHA